MSPAGDGPRAEGPGFPFDPGEIAWEFMRSSGPGGQNVNKVETACRLRLKVEASPSIPDAVKQRLRALFPTRINAAGELTVSASSERSQHANRQAALERLYALLAAAAKRPRVRRATRPTAGSRRRRLEAKKQRSEIKQSRRPPKLPE